MRFYLFAVFLLIGANISQAQKIALRGLVADDKNQAIPYATVSISTDSLSTQDIHYDITDENGTFTIALPSDRPDQRWIAVRSLGYSTYRKQCSITDARKRRITIKLLEESMTLDEITVVGEIKDVRMKGDTVLFNSRSFITGDERNLGELINKMPGMQVDSKGNISYLGKTINKVLINDQDILSSSGIAMNALPANFTHSVELLKNYDDGGIAHKFKSGEELALNLKSTMKTKLKGNIDGAGGVINKFSAKSTLISLFPKLSVTTVINTNNIGDPVFSLEDYLTNIIGYESILNEESQSIIISDEEYTLFFPPENEFSRLSGVVNLNTVWRPDKRYHLKYSTIYNRGTSRGAHTGLETYTLAESSFTNRSKADFEKRSKVLSHYLLQKWNPSPRFSLKAQTWFSLSNTHTHNTFSNEFEQIKLNASENVLHDNVGYRQNVETEMLLGSGIIFFGGNIGLNSRDIANVIHSELLLPPLTYVDGSSAYPYLYDLNKSKMELTLIGHLGVAYPIGEDLYLKGEISYNRQSEELKQIISHTTFKEAFRLNSFKSYLGGYKNKGFIRFKAGVFLSSYNIGMTPNIEFTKKHLFMVEPSVSAELRMSEQHQLKLSASQSISPSSIDNFSRLTWANGYNRLSMPSALTEAFEKTFNVDASYHYNNMFHHLTLWGSLGYSKTNNVAMRSTDAKGLLIQRYYLNGGWRDEFSSSINITKRLGAMPLELKAGGGYSSEKSNFIRLKEEKELLNQQIKASMSLISKYRNSPINVEVAFKYKRLNQRIIPSDMDYWSQEVGGLAKIHLKIASTSLSISLKANRMKESQSTHDFKDIDFFLRYTLKGVELKLTGENIFHLWKDEWVNETLTPTMHSTILYRRLPGNILCSLSYLF